MWCLQGGRLVAAPVILNNPKAAVAYSNIDESTPGLATDVPTGGGASGAKYTVDIIISCNTDTAD